VISSYIVIARDLSHPAGDKSEGYPASVIPGGRADVVVSELLGGDQYDFAVSAVNAVGAGPESAASKHRHDPVARRRGRGLHSHHLQAGPLGTSRESRYGRGRLVAGVERDKRG
jgi:hypothetical protein